MTRKARSERAAALLVPAALLATFVGCSSHVNKEAYAGCRGEIGQTGGAAIVARAYAAGVLGSRGEVERAMIADFAADAKTGGVQPANLKRFAAGYFDANGGMIPYLRLDAGHQSDFNLWVHSDPRVQKIVGASIRRMLASSRVLAKTFCTGRNPRFSARTQCRLEAFAIGAVPIVISNFNARRLGTVEQARSWLTSTATVEGAGATDGGLQKSFFFDPNGKIIPWDRMTVEQQIAFEQWTTSPQVQSRLHDRLERLFKDVRASANC
jgi:hypothetical protein